LKDPDRRHKTRGKGGPLRLPPTHAARVERRPLFPNRVVSANDVARVLIPAKSNRKIGSHWSVDMEWRGQPIYTLTLSERATCPVRSCWEWCMGNRMQLADRIIVDSALMARLNVEIDSLASMYPGGFSVRLHVLGDFASIDYARFWIEAVRAVQPLHCYGFTAHDQQSEIGALIKAASDPWDRFRIRFSYGDGERSANVRVDPPRRLHDEGQTCPADADHDKLDCGRCGLCVSQKSPIIFKLH
jgi:hypothetical protein